MQVARFSDNPHQSHATTIKSIRQYLKVSKHHGMIIKPTGWLDLDIFVDVDFCRRFAAEDHSHSNSTPWCTKFIHCWRPLPLKLNPLVSQIQSLLKTTPTQTQLPWCSQFIIKWSCCPLFWFTRLQACNTCSTTETEYVTLSTAFETLLPMKEIILEAIAILIISSNIGTILWALVFEDKQSAHYSASNHGSTNHTRYFCNKWKWLWEHSNGYTIFKWTHMIKFWLDSSSMRITFTFKDGNVMFLFVMTRAVLLLLLDPRRPD